MAIPQGSQAPASIPNMSTPSSPSVPSSGGGTPSGAGLSLFSSLASISMTYDQGKMRRSILKHNQVMAEYDKWFTQFAAKQAEDRLRRTEAKLLGKARQAGAESGFATESATNLDVEGDIMTGVALDAAVIRTQGNLSSMRIDQQIGEYGLRADLAGAESNIKLAEAISSAAKNTSSIFAKKKSGE